MKKTLLLCFFFGAFGTSIAQLGIGTPLPDSSTQLDVVATDKGVLFPRVALQNSTDTTTISNDPTNNTVSLFVYNTSTIADLISGYYYWNGVKWLRFAHADEIGATTATNFFTGIGAPTSGSPTSPNAGSVYVDESTGDVYTYNGTTWVNQTGLSAETNTTLVATNGTYTYTSEDNSTTTFNVSQTGPGDPITVNPTVGAAGDIYVDESTGDVYTYNGTTWVNQTTDTDLRLIGTANHITKDAGVGSNGTNVGTGFRNTAIGENALSAITSGFDNIAIGLNTLSSVEDARNNIALGWSALEKFTTGPGNIAIGNSTLRNHTTGSENLAMGYAALTNHLTGDDNIALGNRSLRNITTGDNNIALGVAAGGNLTSGIKNLIIGYNIDFTSTTASNQLNIGNIIYGTAIDGTANTISSGNIGIGVPTPSARLDVAGGDVQFQDYPNTRDDSGTTAVNNILYTDAIGNILSAPATSLTTEPWFGVDDNMAATENTEDIYMLGNIVVGSQNNDPSNGGSRKIQAVQGDIANYTFLNSASSYGFIGHKARGTESAPLVVNGGDNVFTLYSQAYDGANYDLASVIRQKVGRTWDGSQAIIPGEIQFGTSNGTNAVAALTIDEFQNTGIGTAIPSARLDVVGGDVQFQEYPNTRDDSATTTAANFLYTDATGNILSAPTNSLTTEPWFGVDDNLAATDNTEDIYMLGNIVVGSQNNDPSNGGSRKIQAVQGDIANYTFLNSASSYGFIGHKARGTESAPLVVNGGDNVFTLYSQAYDGANYDLASVIRQKVGRTWDGSQAIIPGEIQFGTSNGTSAVAALTIDEFQNTGIGTAIPSARLDVAGGDVQFQEYPNTRDDSGTTTASNFLYTDALGNVLSAPTSSINPVSSAKTLNIPAEYAGGVLLNSTGAIADVVGAYDGTNFQNVYRFTTTQASPQIYEISVIIELPINFESWVATASVDISNSTSGVTISSITKLGTTIAGTNNGQTVDVTSTTEAAGELIRVVLQVVVTNAAVQEAGTITLNYNGN